MNNNNIQAITDGKTYFQQLSQVMSVFPCGLVDVIASRLLDSYRRGGTVFLFGNGGSASLASHFACDLGKGTSLPGNNQKRFRVIALTDNIPTMTAWANDSSYDDIFAEQLRNLVQPGDLAFGISCSGNSPNVIKALKVAREYDAVVIGLGGFQGGKMKDLCDICLVVPSENMQIIEDLHLSVAHCLFTIVRDRLAAANMHKVAAIGAT